jgi:hypothetical protein
LLIGRWPISPGPAVLSRGTTPRTPGVAHSRRVGWGPSARFRPVTPRGLLRGCPPAPGRRAPCSWAAGQFRRGPQCFPGGRPPGPPAWPTLGGWARVRRPASVRGDLTWLGGTTRSILIIPYYAPVSRIAGSVTHPRVRGLWGGEIGRGLPGDGKASPPSQGGLRGRGRVGGAGIGPVAGAAAVGPGWRPQNQCPPEVRGGQPAGLSGE